MQKVYAWESELPGSVLWCPKGGVVRMMTLPDVGNSRAVANIGQVTHRGGRGGAGIR
jgi:hypothetical protein